MAAVTADRPRVAIVIGISDYATKKLKTAVKDAWDMAEKLEKVAGFKVMSVCDPDRTTLLLRLVEFKASIPDNSIIIFFYAGHGMVYDSLHYMMTPNCDSPTVNQHGPGYACEVEGVCIEKALTDITMKAKGGAVVALLDTCRATPSATRGDGVGGQADTPLVVNVPEDTQLLKCYACENLKEADDGGAGATNGVYTKRLLQHLFCGIHQYFLEAIEAANLDVRAETDYTQKPEFTCVTSKPFRFKLILKAAAPCPPVTAFSQAPSPSWPEDGSCKHTLEGHTRLVKCCSISPDGCTLVSGSDDNTLRVWDLATCSCKHTLDGHTGYVDCCSISPDGCTLVSGSDDKTLRVWDLDTCSCKHTLQGHRSYVKCSRISSCSFSPDGRTLVSGCQGHDDNTLRVWDLDTGSCKHTLQGHRSWVQCCSISPDGHTLVSGSWDNTLRVWDSQAGHRQLQAHTEGTYKSGELLQHQPS